jgi:hypothetical protein
MKPIILLFLLTGLLTGSERFELRWDGNLCSTSSDQQRQIVRKALRNGVCNHPIGTNKECFLSGFTNAHAAFYDSKTLILEPDRVDQRALADFICREQR